MRKTAVVVGGGAAGAMAARELLRHTDARIILAEPSAEPGRGLAYGAAAPWHLLNSPAGAMSLDADDPGHFVEWLRAQGVAFKPADFAPRRRYGDYLHAMLNLAAVAAPGRLETVQAHVTGLARRDGRMAVAFSDGRETTADDVVLALGNPAATAPIPGLDTQRSHPRYIADPWAPNALSSIPDNAPVLLIGTGLTAVDVILSLFATRRRAPVTAVSRHGLLPRPHRDPSETPAVHAVPPPPVESLARLTRAVRRSVAATGDWRAVVDGLRPSLDALWQALSPEAQRRFLTHTARHWEVHRHRMAPQIAARVADLCDSKALEVRAERITQVVADGPDVLKTTFASRGTAHFAAIVNCAGPGRLPHAANPLTQTLLREGLARTGPHALGLDVRGDGRALDRDGRVDAPLWIVGPLRRGRFWETTAIPEIRDQAQALAARLAAGAAAPALT
ncbi:MAG: FAD/NAD(P)-binding protein [Stackebrandtia sp.]